MFILTDWDVALEGDTMLLRILRSFLELQVQMVLREVDTGDLIVVWASGIADCLCLRDALTPLGRIKPLQVGDIESVL